MALEQVAEDFLAKTLELGAAIARRRASEFLTPADLNVALERLWCACDTYSRNHRGALWCHHQDVHMQMLLSLTCGS